MASAWGNSWGVSWGNSWGSVGAPSVAARSDDGGRRRRRLRPEDIIAIVEAIESTKEQPKPTAKKRKALTRKIVETVGENIFTAALKPVETFVRQEVKQVYQPGVSWAEVHAAVMRIIEAAQAEARRIEQEIEDEDEMILLMAA